MKASPNPLLIRFSETTQPLEWTSQQAKALFDAGIAAERDGTYSQHAVSGTVRVAVAPPADSAMVPYGTDPETAKAHVEQHITRLRREVDGIENILRAYGPVPFIAHLEPQRAPCHPFDVEVWLLGILRSAWTVIEVNGRRFVRSPSGGVEAAS